MMDVKDGYVKISKKCYAVVSLQISPLIVYVQASTDQFRKSFGVQTVKDWNAPQNL